MSVTIKNFFSSISVHDLIAFLTKIADTLKTFFCYKNNKLNETKSKTKKQEKNEYCKKIDDVIDNGTIVDLLDLRK